MNALRLIRFPRRFLATHSSAPASPPPPSSSSSIARTRPPKSKSSQSGLQTWEDAQRWSDMSPRQKVVYATKQTSYATIAVAGLGITGLLGYAVLSELFGSDHGSKVYGRALDTIRQNDDVISVLGSPVRGFREHNRRQNKFLQTYNDENGRKRGFMRFDVSGPDAAGTVNMWLHEGDDGKWEYTYLCIDTPGKGLPSRRVVAEDNRTAVQ